MTTWSQCQSVLPLLPCVNKVSVVALQVILSHSNLPLLELAALRTWPTVANIWLAVDSVVG